MEYWNKRYSDKGKIWGLEPSNAALHALKLFKRHDIKKVLIPGAGYGRHTKFFSTNGYDVTGIEISEEAVNIAKEFDPKSKFILGSALNLPFNDETYDAIFCYNFLHLLLEVDRVLLVKKCYNQLNKNGLVYFTMFSEEEESFGKGKMVEKNTFESKPYRPTHYFTRKDLLWHFKDFSVIETGINEQKENHGDLGLHTHKLRYVFAQKTPNQENF